MSEDEKKKGPAMPDLAKPILDRIEEVKPREIVAYKGTPGLPTAFKARDKHRARLICYLKAIGFKNKDIAAAISGTTAEVARVLKSESAQAEIERVQQEIFVAEPAKMFESILPSAVRIAVNAMMSRKTKTSVRVDAAFKFMDRALGKPTQTIEHNTNLVRELITKIADDSKAEPALDADFVVVQTKGDKNEQSKD
jgi:DNA-binding transcriptional MerR regulator